jgi:integrase/recombinase XerD
VKRSTIAVYLQWVERFETDCRRQGLPAESQLTSKRVGRFARLYARRRGIDARGAHAGARSALHSWACALSELGHELPVWVDPTPSRPALSPLTREFVQFQVCHRGIAAKSEEKQGKHVMGFLGWLRSRRRRVSHLRLRDVDAFVIDLRRRYARRTVADYCSSLRAFIRFLHRTGRLTSDFSSSVASPVIRSGERPPRALPWADVQRLLRGVDRSTPIGRRDYALLLTMTVYGMGAAEVLALHLEDLNWSASQLSVRRPKTGTAVQLPLLPAVARAVVAYLRRGRARHASTRRLFIRMHAPHQPLTSSAIRHIMKTRAHEAGISGRFLGGHALRHSHAGRQIDLGAAPKVVSDILGHRRPESTSAYVSIATDQLRAVALSVPG